MAEKKNCTLDIFWAVRLGEMNPGLTLRATQVLPGHELSVGYFPRAWVGNALSCSQALLAAISHIIKEDTGMELEGEYTARSLCSTHMETCWARFPAEDPTLQLSGVFIPALIRRWGGSTRNVLAIRRKVRSGGDGGEGGNFIYWDDGVTPSDEKLVMIKTTLETVRLHFKGVLSQPKGSGESTSSCWLPSSFPFSYNLEIQ